MSVANYKISVVIPLYKCSASVGILYTQLKKELAGVFAAYEIVFVVDGSPENDWDIVKLLALRDKAVKAVSLDRNYGQHKAINAGIGMAKGDLILVMDGDLQDNPAYIGPLYSELLKGFDIVFARKNPSASGKDRSIFAFAGNCITGVKLDNSIGTFCIFRKGIRETVSNTDFLRFLPALCHDKNLHTGFMEVKRNKRTKGHSAYGLYKRLLLGAEILFLFAPAKFKTLVFSLVILVLFAAFVAGLFVRGVFEELAPAVFLIVGVFQFLSLLMAASVIVFMRIVRIRVKNMPPVIRESVNFA